MDRTTFNPEEYWNAKHQVDYPGLFMPTELARRSLRYFKRNNVHNILELGCGRSGDSYFFASKGYCVVGLDISVVALADLSVYRPEHSSLSLVQADLRNGIPLQAMSFDAIFSRLSLHYFSDQITIFIFNEMRRILKNSGCIAISVKSEPHSMSIQAGKAISGDHPRRLFTIDHMKMLLRDYSKVQIREGIIVSGMKKESAIIQVFAKR